MITVIAEICVKPGRRAAVLEAIQTLIPAVLNEEGCHQYDAMVDYQAQVPWQQTSPDSIYMLERWDSLSHLEQHLRMPHMESHNARIKDDVQDINIQILQAASQA